MKWITAEDLQQFATRMPAASLLPELVRRLVRASSERIEQSRFPSGESVRRPGWDGEVVASGQPPFVPAGPSVWELSTDSDVTGKGFDDLRKRSADDAPALSCGVPRRSATYVAVTMRRWVGTDATNRAAFVRQGRESGVWNDVQVIDADDLEAWIESHPSVGVWLARKIGKFTGEIFDIEAFLREYSDGVQPRLAPELLLCGRADAAESFINGAKDGPHSWVIQADSPGEAVAFVAAAILSRDEDDPVRNDLVSRCVVISQLPAARELLAIRSPLCVVLKDQAVEAAPALAAQGHSVIAAYGNSFSRRATVPFLRLERARRQEFIDVLMAMGLHETEARIRATACNASVTVFRRLNDPFRSSSPRWADFQTLRRLMGPMLAGAWEHGHAPDQDILSRLAGTPYEEVSNAVDELLLSDDPPVQRGGDATALNAPSDILSLALQLNVVNPQALTRLHACAVEVFSERDPALDLPPKERAYAGLYGKKRLYSEWLRSGIAEVLRLLSVHGGTLAPLGHADSQSFVNAIVSEIPELNSDPSVFASLDSLLPALFEAAPSPFLHALEELSRGEGARLAPLFEGSEDSMFGHPRYLGILHGLEVLAWDPQHLVRATTMLARMAEVDPGGQPSNRPITSLALIFLPHAPHTNASAAARRMLLQRLVARHPTIAWDLLHRLLPGETRVWMSTAKPAWRESGASEREVVTYESAAIGYQAALDMAVSLTKGLASRWLRLVEAASLLGEASLDSLLAALAEARQTMSQTEEHGLWNGLRALAGKHRDFADAGWALPETMVLRLDEAAAALAPKDVIARSTWLFDQTLPDYSGGDMGYESRMAHALTRRNEAMVEITAGGAPAVLALARAARAPGLVAEALVLVEPASFSHDVVLAALLADPSEDWFAAQVCRAGLDAYGTDWGLAVFQAAAMAGVPPRGLAHLVVLWPDNEQTQEIVAGLDGVVAAEYWAIRDSWIRSDSEAVVRWATQELIRAGRSLDLLPFLGGSATRTPSATLMQVLEAGHKLLLANPEAVQRVDTYWLREIFKQLRTRADVDTDALAQLEYGWLPAVVSYTETQRLALHDVLADRPAFFVELLSQVYRTDDGTEAASADDRAYEDEDAGEQGHARAQAAYRILESWREIPWLDATGGIDYERMQTWAVTALDLAAKAGRRASASRELGKLLAYSPLDSADGFWPIRSVRDLLESLADDDVERGILIELFNKRGPTWRSPNGGGDQERDLAAEARVAAGAFRAGWPRTAALLDRNAEQWDAHARWEDRQAEENRLQL